MMRIMRPVHLVALGLVLVGCAHTTETRESSAELVAAPATREVVVIDEPPPAETEAPRARPRLTQTITLGQSNGEATYSAAPAPAAQGQGGNTNNVVVNNHVIVQQAPPVYYGGYGGYGYGYGTYGRGGHVRSGSSSTSSTSWGSNGFEGARRTAAPGQTPAVGGNWAPAPSYGPAPMR